MTEKADNQDNPIQALLASVAGGLWTIEIDAAGRRVHVYTSPGVPRVMGRPAEFFLQGPEAWLGIVHPEDRPRMHAVMERIMAGELDEDENEYRVIWPDGSVHWVRDRVRVRRSPDGVTRLDGIITDLTGRKEAQEALLTSEEQLQRIVETIADGILIVSRDGRFLFANAAAEALLGVRRSTLARRNYFDPIWKGVVTTVDGQDVPTQDYLFSRVLRSGESIHGVERLIHRPDGSQVIVSGNLTPLRDGNGTIVGVVTCFSDVTQRHKAEEALRASEERYRLLFERNLAGVFRTTVAGRILDCNDAFARILGCRSREDAMARPISEFYFDPAERRAFLEVLRQRRFLTNFELRMRRRDGTPVWVLENVSLLDGDGPELLEGSLFDITERKRAEGALQASEAKYRSLIEDLEQSVFLKDAGLAFVAANKPFCQGLGRTEAEIVGRTDFDFFPARLAEKYRHDDLRVLRDGQRLEVEEPTLIGGKCRTIRVVKTPVKDEQGQSVGVLGIYWDVTEQRQLEAQLQQAQKMEAVGQLAGGVAHDFNNLLTAILGNLSLIATSLPAADPNRELAAAAEKAALRAATLTRQLLGFSRQTVLRPQPTNLNGIIDEVVRLLRRTIDPRITLETSLAADLWTVQADPSQMSQILMNLCLNARDAMPQGGRLTIETANLTLREADVQWHLDARPGEFVRLAVRDTGHGMTPEVRARIFEPFFTTKGTGKGTGLGLAVVFGIVKGHLGWIDCTSQPTQGTRFDIYLPRSASRAESGGEGTLDPRLSSGHETILLVDDEPLLRQLGQHILQRYGYDVLLAHDGQHALEVYQRERHRIDLVLLDLTMPRLSGRDTFRRLQQLNPTVRVLFASGYSAEHLTDTEQHQSLGFVAKPYSPDELILRVRSALDGSVRAAVGPPGGEESSRGKGGKE